MPTVADDASASSRRQEVVRRLKAAAIAVAEVALLEPLTGHKRVAFQQETAQ